MNNLFDPTKIDREAVDAARAEKAAQQSERDAHVANVRREREAADKVARAEAEQTFRERCKAEFMAANTFANEDDFERLYSKMRDSILIANWEQSRQDAHEKTTNYVSSMLHRATRM